MRASDGAVWGSIATRARLGAARRGRATVLAGRDRRARGGTKDLLAAEDGYRESTESWARVMRDFKARRLSEPRLVVGDGALEDR
jgi:hypothetical protein